MAKSFPIRLNMSMPTLSHPLHPTHWSCQVEKDEHLLGSPEEMAVRVDTQHVGLVAVQLLRQGTRHRGALQT